MKKILKQNKGFTLVEVVATMVLTSIFMLCAVSLTAPACKVFYELINMNRQQTIANILVEDIRSHFDDVAYIGVYKSSGERITDTSEGDVLVFNNTSFTGSGGANINYIMSTQRQSTAGDINESEGSYLSIRYFHNDSAIDGFNITDRTADNETNDEGWIAENDSPDESGNYKEFALSSKMYMTNQAKVTYSYNQEKGYIKIKVKVYKEGTEYEANKTVYIDVS